MNFKKYAIAAFLGISAIALAGSDPDSVFRLGLSGSDSEIQFSRGDAVIKYDSGAAKLQFSNNAVDFKDIGSGAGGAGGTNTLVDDNADFEAGDPPTSWTASGGTFTAEAGSPLFGGQSGQWDSDGNAQTLASASKNIASFIGIQGKRCVVQVAYAYPTGSNGDYALQAYDGSNPLASVDLELTTAGSREAFAVFTCPSSGTIQLRLLSQVADADAITIDDAFLGSGIRENDVASSELAAVVRYPGTLNCTGWNVASTTIAAFSTDADCPSPTVDFAAAGVVVDTTDDDLPTFEFSNLPPGRYVARAQGNMVVATAAAEGTMYLRVDGTEIGSTSVVNSAAANTGRTNQVEGTFELTSAAAVSMSMVAKVSAGNLGLNNDSITGYESELKLVLVRYPLESEKAVTLDAQSGFARAQHGDDCLFSTSSTTYEQVTDASCTFSQSVNRNLTLSSALITSNPTTGVRFTPNRGGVYKVTAHVSIDTGAAARTLAEMRNLSSTALDSDGYDSTAGSGSSEALTLVGYVDGVVGVESGVDIFIKTSSGTSSVVGVGSPVETRAIAWIVEYVEQSFPQPIIPDAITSPNEGVGLKMIGFGVDFSSGTPTLTSPEYGGAVDNIVDDGVGAGDVNFTSGFFSETPICTCTAADNNRARICQLGTLSSSQVQLVISDDAAAATDDATAYVHCMGK